MPWMRDWSCVRLMRVLERKETAGSLFLCKSGRERLRFEFWFWICYLYQLYYFFFTIEMRIQLTLEKWKTKQTNKQTKDNYSRLKHMNVWIFKWKDRQMNKLIHEKRKYRNIWVNKSSRNVESHQKLSPAPSLTKGPSQSDTGGYVSRQTNS